jgi:ketosteroid isomerase-like protein
MPALIQPPTFHALQRHSSKTPEETFSEHTGRHGKELLRCAIRERHRGAVNLMTDDIEWITMLDSSHITGRGPHHVVDEMLKPLAEEWESYAPSPSEFIADGGSTVVSLGRFTCVHNTTGKRADAQYAHIWTIETGKVARFRHYIDTRAIAEAREPRDHDQMPEPGPHR